MSNIGAAFKILDTGETPLQGYRKSSGHMIYSVKMEFTRKARWVKDGHRTPDPESSSYAGVVSRERIRIILTHADLHGVSVMAADVRMHTYKLQPQRSTTLSVVLNSVLKILERKPSSQEPYMVANVLEEPSGTILEAA